MTYLLDTMVVSEVTKLRPSERVVSWMDAEAGAAAYISVITLGEIWSGVARMPDGEAHTRLEHFSTLWIEEKFRGRIIDVDSSIARRWGALRAELGRTLPRADAMIAATALVRGLTVATRNVRDFAALGVPVLNPWA